MSNVNFENLRIKEIHSIVNFVSDSHHWNTRQRNDYIIGIQTHGKAIHTLNNNTKFTLAENYIYFFNKKDDYTVDVLEPCKSYSIHFTTYENIITETFCHPTTNPATFLSIFHKAEAAKLKNNELSLYSLAYQFCANIKQTINRMYAPKDSRMISAKDYFDTHFNEPDCLKSIIDKYKISSRRFADLFKNAYNVPPKKYIISRKIDYAKGLLLTNYYSITDISAMCNFSDVYYFSKQFKNNVGLSPTDFIKLHTQSQ